MLHKLKDDFIKCDQTKHISFKIFYSREFQDNSKINVQQI